MDTREIFLILKDGKGRIPNGQVILAVMTLLGSHFLIRILQCMSDGRMSHLLRTNLVGSQKRMLLGAVNNVRYGRPEMTDLSHVGTHPQIENLLHDICRSKLGRTRLDAVDPTGNHSVKRHPFIIIVLIVIHPIIVKFFRLVLVLVVLLKVVVINVADAIDIVERFGIPLNHRTKQEEIPTDNWW